MTLDDVARRAGVSTATASRALGSHPHVAAATRERVREAAAALDYVASPEAARLAGGPGGSTGRVAVLVPHPSRWFYGELLEGLEDDLRVADLDLMLFRVGDPAQRREFFARLPARRKVDAVVVLGFGVAPDERDRLAALGVDVVGAGGRWSAYPSVGIDDHGAARRAVDHLLHLGHHRIAMIAGDDEEPPESDPGGRAAGYRAAVAEAGLDDVRVAVAPSGEGGAEGMAQLLGRRRPPTAVLAHCDEVALGALRTLRRAGLRVPEDISVIGVDDHPAAELVDLTTVAQPVREQGRLAGVLVRRALGDPSATLPDDGVDLGDPPRLTVATRLVLRGTTAPPDRAPAPARTGGSS